MRPEIKKAEFHRDKKALELTFTLKASDNPLCARERIKAGNLNRGGSHIGLHMVSDPKINTQSEYTVVDKTVHAE